MNKPAAEAAKLAPAQAAPIVVPAVDGRSFAIQAARLAAETRCHSVVVLDVRDVSPITDYLVLATGTSGRQMRGVAGEIEEAGDEVGQHVAGRSMTDQWILLDYVDIVVHLFEQETRMFYDLDSLWGDAPRVEWK